MDLTNTSVADVVALLGETYGVNVVSDVFLNGDVPRPRVALKNVPLKAALLQLSEMFGREMTVVNNIVVWRHRQAPRWAANDVFALQNRTLAWKDAGRVHIERAEKPAAPKTNPEAPSSEKVFPASVVSLEAASAPVKSVLDAFSKQVGWKATIEKSLADRRVCARLRAVTPGQALEAFTALFNAAEQVVIGQTDAQREQDARWLDPRNPIQKAYDALRDDLLRRLTPEQRAQLENGETVGLGIGSLPAALQAKFGSYIQQVEVAARASIVSVPYELDPATFSRFTIVLKPNLSFEIHGFISNAQPPFENGTAIIF